MQFTQISIALFALVASVAAKPAPAPAGGDQMRGYLAPKIGARYASEYTVSSHTLRWSLSALNWLSSQANLLSRRTNCRAYPCEDADDCAQYNCDSCILVGSVKRCDGHNGRKGKAVKKGKGKRSVAEVEAELEYDQLE